MFLSSRKIFKNQVAIERFPSLNFLAMGTSANPAWVYSIRFNSYQLERLIRCFNSITTEKFTSESVTVNSEGSRISRRGPPTYYLANFSRKLHENEEILGRGASFAPPKFATGKLNCSWFQFENYQDKKVFQSKTNRLPVLAVDWNRTRRVVVVIVWTVNERLSCLHNLQMHRSLIQYQLQYQLLNMR